jgi:hypothetical protein
MRGVRCQVQVQQPRMELHFALPLLHESLGYDRLVCLVQDRFLELMAVQRFLQNDHHSTPFLRPIKAKKHKHAFILIQDRM